jgi:hypothetical protein
MAGRKFEIWNVGRKLKGRVTKNWIGAYLAEQEKKGCKDYRQRQAKADEFGEKRENRSLVSHWEMKGGGRQKNMYSVALKMQTRWTT